VPTVTRFRRRVAGVSLIVFAGALLAQELAGAHSADDPASIYALAADGAGRLRAETLLLLLSTIALIPGIFGIVHLVRERGARLVHIGAVLGVLGALGHMAIVCVGLVFLEMPKAGDRAAMLALIDRLNESQAVGLIVFPLILCFGLSMLFLSLATWRAGLVPGWVAGAVVAALVVHFGLPEDVPGVGAVANALGALGFVVIGVRILRLADGAWAEPARVAAVPQPA
jgi:hypothetical protein